jgi:CMP-N-acetylneuraminic acid synthetase
MVGRTYIGVVQLKVLAVIVARAGSKRIPDKNMKILGGKTLIDWAIDAALDSTLITKTVISTDSDRYGRHAETKGIKYIKRPDTLSLDDSDISEATKHALQESGDYDLVVTLQAAVPLRPKGAIDALIREVISSNANGGLTMIPRSPFIWYVRKNITSSWWPRRAYPRTQTIDWRYCEEVNAIQVARSKIVWQGERWEFPLSILELPSWCAIDIDTKEDLVEANEYITAISELYIKERDYKTFTVTGR